MVAYYTCLFCGADMLLYKDVNVCMSVCVSVSVCPPLRLLMTSGVIWTPHDWLDKFYSFYMAAVVVISSGHGLRELKCVMVTNLIRVSQHYISRYITVTVLLKAAVL